MVVKVLKDLAIEGDPAKLDNFIDDVTNHLADGWSRDTEGEARVNETAMGADDPQYAFRWKGSRYPTAALFLVRKHARIEVTNIVPRGASELSREDYNAILDDFANRNARPSAVRLGLTVSTTSDKLTITSLLTSEAAQRLRRFSSAANKASGSSHPMDSRRWVAFIVQVHRENAKLDGETLRRWLIEEERWPGESAFDLAVEFEFARNLLRAYDEER